MRWPSGNETCRTPRAVVRIALALYATSGWLTPLNWKAAPARPAAAPPRQPPAHARPPTAARLRRQAPRSARSRAGRAPGPMSWKALTGGWCEICSRKMLVPSARCACQVSPRMGLNGLRHDWNTCCRPATNLPRCPRAGLSAAAALPTPAGAPRCGARRPAGTDSLAAGAGFFYAISAAPGGAREGTHKRRCSRPRTRWPRSAAAPPGPACWLPPAAAAGRAQCSAHSRTRASGSAAPAEVQGAGEQRRGHAQSVQAPTARNNASSGQGARTGTPLQRLAGQPRAAAAARLQPAGVQPRIGQLLQVGPRLEHLHRQRDVDQVQVAHQQVLAKVLELRARAPPRAASRCGSPPPPLCKTRCRVAAVARV